MHPRKIQFPIFAMALRLVAFGALVIAFVFAGSGIARAQIPADVFRVTYFDNNLSGTIFGGTAPLAVAHVLNPGVAFADLCASIYVWRADQQLAECCSCLITTNGLLSFFVFEATLNPGDGGGFPNNGSLDIISSATVNGKCGDGVAASPTPTPALRSWATHVNFDTANGAFDVTETELLDTTLSSGELKEIGDRCGGILANGSGHGTCDFGFAPDGSQVSFVSVCQSEIGLGKTPKAITSLVTR